MVHSDASIVRLNIETFRPQIQRRIAAVDPVLTDVHRDAKAEVIPVRHSQAVRE